LPDPATHGGSASSAGKFCPLTE
jgi:hypothetical protein